MPAPTTAEQAALVALAENLIAYDFEEDFAFDNGLTCWRSPEIPQRGDEPDLVVSVAPEIFDNEGVPHPAPLTVYVQYDGEPPDLEIPLTEDDMLARVQAVLEAPFVPADQRAAQRLARPAPTEGGGHAR